MFITHLQDREFLPAFQGYEDAKAWTSIEITNMPWFIVHVDAQLSDACTESLLISNATQLEKYLAALLPGSNIYSIHVALPSIYTDEKSWVVKELHSVSRATCHEGSPVWLLLTVDDVLIQDPPGAENVTREKVVYQHAKSPA